MSEVIRLLTVEDVSDFRELRLRACREEPVAFTDSYEELSILPEADFEKFFHNGWIVGAYLDNVLVAMAGLYRNKSLKIQHKGNIWGVYVANEARGLGISRKCMVILIEQARKAGLESVQLSTDASNPVSVGLYKSLGFEAWGVEKHFAKLPNRYVDEVYMTLFLK
jgi:ribosomal protein S18 acetylase RimI-like enzyme